jgi:CBS domain containing-hemolysin-like protein
LPGKCKKERPDSAATEISLLASAAALEKQATPGTGIINIKKPSDEVNRQARDIMVEKDHVVFLDESMSLTDAFLSSHVHRHTRYPLLSADKTGFSSGIYQFQRPGDSSPRHTAENPTLKGICRPIMFIPETMHVNAILRRMIREYQHIAIVQNSKGNTTGLVTLEDVIESLVGEIEDEYDRPPEMMVMLSENRWRIGGAVPLSKIKEKAFSELPESGQTIDELVKSHFNGSEPKEFFGFEFHTAYR